MSNRQKATKPLETFEMSDQDEADLQKLAETGDVPYHTILEVWQNVLAPAEADSERKIAPGWASKITTMYPQIKIQQMKEFGRRYFAKIAELKDILDEEIATDADAFSHLSPEEDRDENRVHYLNLLLLWQSRIIIWEAEWDCTDELSAVELGVISEVHKMFFSEIGVTSYLDNIGFQFTEDDQVEMATALDELKAASSE